MSIHGKFLPSPPLNVAAAFAAVLNGLMYEYSGLDIHTALPVLSDSYIAAVNETYGLVEDLDPMLQGASLVPTAALVFSEATRLRYFHYARSGYLEGLKRLWLGLWSDSVVAEFVAATDLTDVAFLAKFPVVVLMESSGLTQPQLDGLLAYAHAGGSVVVAGDALLFDAGGNFTTAVVGRLRETLGVAYGEKVCSKFGLRLVCNR